MNKIHMNDIGTVFQVLLKDDNDAVDVSSATGENSKQFIFEKPSGATLTKTAVFVTDGTNGLLKYTTIENDLNEEGVWKLQVKVVLTEGTWRSNVESFTVYVNL